MLQGGGGKGAHQLLCPRKIIPPLLDVLQEGGMIFPSASQVILRLCCISPGYLPAFSKGTLQALRTISATPPTSKITVFKPCWLQKLTKIIPSCLPSQRLLGSILLACIPGLLHSLLFFSSTMAPIPPQHPQSVSPLSHISTLPTFL